MKKWILLLSSIGLMNIAVQVVAKPLPDTFIYTISKSGGEKHYLIGTVHVSKSPILNPLYLQALNNSEQLVVETDESDQEKLLLEMIKMKSQRNAQPLSQTFGMVRIHRLQDIFIKYKKVDKVLAQKIVNPNTKQPIWMLLLQLESIYPQGYVPDYGIDMLLFQQAKQQHKIIKNLEGIEVLEILEAVPESAMIRLLDISLAKPQQDLNRAQKILENYQHNYANKVWNIIQKENQIWCRTVPRDCVVADKFNHALLDERNQKWLPKIERYLDEKKTTVAVGAAHLFGKKGLIALLRAHGYLVEPVFANKK